MSYIKGFNRNQGVLIPVVVDAATGNWYEFEQEMINSNLEKQ
ncbi:MAG: hypothetical protein ACI83H_002928 [Glaciecola sp.]|jgi:hypothetical protein